MMYRVSTARGGYSVQRSVDGRKWVNIHYCSKETAERMVKEYNEKGHATIDWSGVHFIRGINGY